MNFPLKVRVAGFDYTISTVGEVLKVPLKELGYKEKGVTQVLGSNDYSKQEIIVCTHTPEDRQKEVLLHEVLHAVFNHYRIPLPEEIDAMEDVIGTLSEGLFQVLRDNPEFVKVYLEQPE